MASYIYREDSGYEERFEAATDEAAEEYGRELLRTGDYGQGQAEKTFRVHATVARLAVRDGETVREDSRDVIWTFDPPEPKCVSEAAAEHDWEEESVRGSGGGILIREGCASCGLVRITDTWDHDHVTGEIMETTVYKRADVTA